MAEQCDWCEGTTDAHGPGCLMDGIVDEDVPSGPLAGSPDEAALATLRAERDAARAWARRWKRHAGRLRAMLATRLFERCAELKTAALERERDRLRAALEIARRAYANLAEYVLHDHPEFAAESERMRDVCDAALAAAENGKANAT